MTSKALFIIPAYQEEDVTVGARVLSIHAVVKPAAPGAP